MNHPTPLTNAYLVALDQIDVTDDLNGRLELNRDRVARLAAQIQRSGLTNPVTLRPAGHRYELIAGRHRLAAYEMLRYARIPAIVREETDKDARLIRLAENVTRTQLSPIEEALQLAELLNNTPGGVDALAEQLGRSQNWILDRLDLCEWPPALQEHVHTGKIKLAAAKHLVRIEPPELRDERIAQAARFGINTRTAAEWARDANPTTTPETDPSQNPMNHALAAIETETRTRCFGCRTLVQLETTIPVRLCSNCLAELTPNQTPEPLPQPTPIEPGPDRP